MDISPLMPVNWGGTGTVWDNSFSVNIPISWSQPVMPTIRATIAKIDVNFVIRVMCSC